MKYLCFAFILLLSHGLLSRAFAQAPNAIPYQAVARDATGNLIPNQLISLRFTLHDSSANGNIVYQETHSATTNTLGLCNVNLGQGTPVQGIFSSINWKQNSKFLQVELDTAGGSNYTNMGTTQMLSVPYAIYAEKAGTIPPGTNIGDVQYWNGSSWVMVPPGLPGQVLQVSQNNIPKWSGVSFASLYLNPVQYEITYNIVYITGYVTSTGSNAYGDSTLLKSRGICWDTLPDPTLANSKSYQSDQFMGISATLNNLLPSKMYYVRGYVKNDAGIAYGNQISFTTLASVPPTLTTAIASSITGGSANCGGDITDNGGTNISVRGVCWSTSPNPTIADDKTVGINPLIGSFTSSMNHLSRSTTYYIRAYATNAAGFTGYGNEISITTTSAFTIGASYLGGYIAYMLQSGDPGYSAFSPHGIIAAPDDLSNYANWSGGVTTANPITPNTAIGTGNSNTTTIVNTIGPGTYAAKLCYDLVLNGYSNWYLPSLNELNLLYANRFLIGGFYTSPDYWSSSDDPANAANAKSVSFQNGTVSNSNKNNNKFVRPIKSF